MHLNLNRIGYVGGTFSFRCIQKEMLGTTRILVTNQLNLLSQCDHVVVIGAPGGGCAGTIEEQGSFDELVAKV